MFLGSLLLLNLIQAFATPLIYDETYYWYYAKDLAWGYFDHPPMVALLVKAGGLLFRGELGVRLIGCLLSTATVALLWTLIDSKKKEKYIPHFFLMSLAMVLFHAYGFFTLPDTPLLFFVALFLVVYRRFLQNGDWVTALLLGLCMAGLMYSKYHAVLVIIFVVLSNPRLVLNRKAWLAVGVALLAYAPHLIWLVDHDFISVKYHLFERPNDPYSFTEYTLGYVLNVIVNFGLLFPWFFWALWKTKPKTPFERALLFLTYGVILFFFMSSFHRRAQAQWVIVICVPMLVLSFQYFLRTQKGWKWIYRLGVLSLVLLLYARVWLVYQPLLPFISYETHGPKEWVKTLKDIVGDTPVVFENSYRRASMYSFYSGSPAFSYNNIFYRQNQYSIDNSEDVMQDHRVAYVTPFASSGDFSYTPFRSNVYYGTYIDKFESYRKLRCLLSEHPITLEGKKVLKVYNPYGDTIPLQKLRFSVAYLDRYKDIVERKELAVKAQADLLLLPKDTTYLNFEFPQPEKELPHFLKFSISENGLQPGINSSSLPVKP